MVSLSTAYTDAAGNTGTAAQSVNYAVDTKAPTASITLNDSALKIGETATATITFSEAPTGFALEDLSAQSGQLSNLSAATTNQDGTVTYTATFTPAADIEDTTNVVSLSTAYTDAAGNTGTAATSANYTVDTKAPTATITLSDSALKSGETATVTVTFSEAPTGFALEDLSAQNGQLSNLSAATTNQDGTVTYTATFTPSTDIEDTTNVVSLSTGYTDTAGNTGTAATSANYTVDTKAPTVAINPISGGFVNDAEDESSLKISGTATGADGLLVKVYVGEVLTTPEVIDGAWSATLTSQQVKDSLTAGTVSVTADVSDAAGNAATQGTASFVYDNNAEFINSAAEFTDLVAGKFTFAEGVDVLVTGTAFLGGTGTPNQAAAVLFADADVTLELTGDAASGDVGAIISGGDAYLDTLTASLAASGIDEIALSDAQVSALLAANVGLTLDAGVDVLVNGTAFLGGTGTPNQAAAVLFADADVTVELTGDAVSGDVGAIISGGDAYLDTLTANLIASGVDEIALSDAQVSALLAANVGLTPDLSFDAGVDVLVTGTAFLGGAGAPNQAAAAVLFADADVTVELTGDAVSGDVGAIISGGDAYLDTLTANLIASGVDEIALSDAQVSALLAANVGLTPDLSFDAGVDVLVTGTAFLGGAGAPNQAAAAVLFADADVTVEVGSSALDEILVLGSEGARDGAFDNLVADLQAAGVDNLEFSADQIEALAAAGVNFDAGSPLGVIVQGTSFLSSGTNIATLFNPLDESTVTVRLSDLEINGFLANAPSFDSTLDALDAAGVDAVQIDVGQAMQLSDAGLDFDVQPGLDVVVQGTHFLEKGLSSGSELFSGGGLVSKLWPGGPNTPPLPPLPPLQAQADISSEFGPSAFAQVLMEEPAGADVAALEDALSMPDPFLAGDDVLAQVELLSDTIASAAYVDILSTDDLLQALQDVGLGSGAMTDNPLSDLMMVLAAAPMASNPLDAGVDRMAAGGGLLEGLSGGIVSDAGDLASLLDPAAQDSPHHDVGLPTAEDASALFNTLAAQQGGIQVQVLGGMETAAADPFDPFQQQKT